MASNGKGYDLEGSLLEACSCGILCPCWVGEDPDGGECFAVNAYHFDRGSVAGIDVSGLSFARVCHIPGNVLKPGSWKVVDYADAKGSDQQRRALFDVFHGKYGGPLGDLAGLVGEVIAEETASIKHEVRGGEGTLIVEGAVEAHMQPFRAADGTISTLRDSLFSTVPGSPAWVGKASKLKVTLPKYNFNWDYEGRNAIQAEYKIAFAG